MGFTVKINLNEFNRKMEEAKRTTSEFSNTLKIVPRETDNISKALGKAADQVIKLAGAYLTLREAMSFLRRGVEANATWEQSKIGIASVIASVNTLQDAQGNVLTGVDAYNASLKLAEEAMNRIKIMGLETTATTEDLVAGFQQLIGPASAAGLTMEQTLSFTTQMVQALGAIGIPFNQLSAEARSLLDGTIVPTQDRLATTLGITGDMVRGWKEQGILAQKLMEKLQPFALAGQDVAKTWAAIKSNMQDAIDSLAGNATKGLYENLIQASLEFNDAIINVSEGGASENISNLADAFENLSNALGEGILGATQALISGLRTLNDNFDAISSAATLASGAFAGWALVNKTNLIPSIKNVSLALSEQYSSFKETFNAAKEAASEEVKSAQQALLSAQEKEKAAKASYALSLANKDTAVSSRQVRQADAAQTATLRQLLAAQNAVQAQTEKLAVAQSKLDVATKKASLSMKGLSAAGMGFKGLLSVLGGPLGAVLTAAGVATAYLASKQTEAEKAADLHAKSLNTLNKLTSDAVKENKKLSDKLGEVAEAQRSIAIDAQTQAITKFAGAIKLLDFSSATGFLPQFREQASALDEMADAVFTGKESFSAFENALAAFYNELKKNGEESSRLGERIKKALDLANQGAAAETVLRALRGETVNVSTAIDGVTIAANKAGDAITAAFDPKKLQSVLASLDYRKLFAGLDGLRLAQAQALQQAGKSAEDIEKIITGQVKSLESDQILLRTSAAYQAEQNRKTAEEARRKREQEAKKAASDAEAQAKKAEADAKAVAEAVSGLETQINRLTMSDEDFREWELTNRTLPELIQKTGGATAQVEKFAEAQRRAWADADAKKAQEEAAKNAEGRANFYKELAEKSGDYTHTIEAQNYALQKQSEEWRNMEIPLSDILKMMQFLELEISRDPFAGAIRGLKKYGSEATNVAAGLENAFTGAFTSVEDAFVNFAMTGKTTFSDLTNSIIADLMRIAVRMSITGPLAGALGSGLSSLFNFGGSTATASVMDNSISSGWANSFMGNLKLFATGGVASPSWGLPSSGGILTRPAYFHDGMNRAYARGGLSVAGEAGPEVFMPAVPMSDGKYGVRVQGMGSSSPVVNVTVINNAGAQVETSQRENEDGSLDLEIMIDQAVARNMVKRSGATSNVLRKGYGLGMIPTSR